MFMGLCPGNVGAMTYFDMARREAQRDFADGIGVCSRTMVEGLFGVRPDALAGELRIHPGFPADWNDASMRHPDFNFEFHREGMRETYRIESKFPRPMALRLHVNAPRTGIDGIRVNGQPARWQQVENPIGPPQIVIESSAAPRHEVVITGKGDRLAEVRGVGVVAQDGDFTATFGGAVVQGVADPQLVVQHWSGGSYALAIIAAGTPGDREVFVKLHQENLSWWTPVNLELRPLFEIVPSARQGADYLRFRIRNNSPELVTCESFI